MPTVVNKSTVVTDDECRKMVAACDRQLKEHFAPAHDLAPWNLTFQRQAYIHIYMVDNDASVPDALAYHDFDGRPVGVVLCDTIKQYTGTVDYVFGPDGISTALSHEYLEIALDRTCDRLGDWYWLEACDAVQGYSYEIDGVCVSDFCLRNWWTLGTNGPWDYLGLLDGPQKIGRGGYQVHYTQTGGVQVNGEKPPWHGWRSLSR